MVMDISYAYCHFHFAIYTYVVFLYMILICYMSIKSQFKKITKNLT